MDIGEEDAVYFLLFVFYLVRPRMLSNSDIIEIFLRDRILDSGALWGKLLGNQGTSLESLDNRNSVG